MLRRIVCRGGGSGSDPGRRFGGTAQGQDHQARGQQGHVPGNEEGRGRRLAYDLHPGQHRQGHQEDWQGHLGARQRRPEGGPLQNIDAVKGLAATIDVSGGKVTEIILGGGKKKKNQ